MRNLCHCNSDFAGRPACQPKFARECSYDSMPVMKKLQIFDWAVYQLCPSYPYFLMQVKEFQALHDYNSDHHSESFKRCKYLLRQLTAQSNGDVTCLHIISHPTLPTYCNIGAKRSPRTSSTFLIHRNVSPSTAS